MTSQTTSPTTRSKPSKKSPILSLDHLSLSYPNHPIIKDTNISINHGDLVCIVGINGAGKSTLIKCILGLIKPTSGHVSFCKNLKRTTIGYLPQETKIDPNFPATVLEIVLSGTLGHLKSRPFYGAEEYSSATNALKTLGISDLKNHSFSDLSGGQKQKVLLARALAATRELLILDEPSNNLDPSSRKDFYRLLKRLNQDHLTILMITHDLDATDLIGNKVLSINQGIVTLSSTSTYLKQLRPAIVNEAELP